MFRDLPERLQGQIHESLGPRVRKHRRVHPGMLMEMMHRSAMDIDDPALGWLMILSQFKEEAPWLYEVGLDVYNALRQGENLKIANAIARLVQVLHSVRRGPMAEMMIDSPEIEMAVHELGRMAHHMFVGRKRPRAGKPETKVKAAEE